MTMPMTSVVVIPTYNEATGINDVLDAVIYAAPRTDILVVDDNSPDGTADLVRAHPGFGKQVHLLSRPGKAGLGAAYRAGFAWALEREYEVIVQMDADLSHPPARVPNLIAALRRYDIAIGSRYIPGGAVVNWPLRRRLLSRIGNLYVRLVLSVGVHDTTAGFRAFRRQALIDLGVQDSEANGYAFQIENTWRADRLGLGVVEVPITFTDRTTGTSKMSGAIAREAITLAMVWRWQELRRRFAPATSNTLQTSAVEHPAEQSQCH